MAVRSLATKLVLMATEGYNEVPDNQRKPPTSHTPPSYFAQSPAAALNLSHPTGKETCDLAAAKDGSSLSQAPPLLWRMRQCSDAMLVWGYIRFLPNSM